jgi:hypothetical protein
MNLEFVAIFSPIVANPEASTACYRNTTGMSFEAGPMCSPSNSREPSRSGCGRCARLHAPALAPMSGHPTSRCPWQASSSRSPTWPRPRLSSSGVATVSCAAPGRNRGRKSPRGYSARRAARRGLLNAMVPRRTSAHLTQSETCSTARTTIRRIAAGAANDRTPRRDTLALAGRDLIHTMRLLDERGVGLLVSQRTPPPCHRHCRERS